MSEELNVATPATDQAPVETTTVTEPTVDTSVLDNAVATAPEAPAAIEPVKAEQATIEKVDAAAAEQPPKTEEVPSIPCSIPQTPNQIINFEITDEVVEKAIAAIKKTHKSGPAMFQRELRISFAHANELIAHLASKGILGSAKVSGPREILIELPPRNIPNRKPAVQKNGKPKMTDEERTESWRKHLQEIGHYTDAAFIDAMCQYAQKNPGYNPRAKWGSCLVVMINRLHSQLLNRIPKFTRDDGEFVQKELMRFFFEKPLGDTPAKWVENYASNMEQREAVSKFFGINCSYREMRGQQKLVMTAIRDAAWPNKDEEQRGTGGTYAERFHYFALCLVRFCTDGFSEAIFGGCYHSEPTDEYVNRIGGGRRPVAKRDERFVNGKCALCGSDVTKDSDGNDICSNPICEYNIAQVANDAPVNFRRHERREAPQTDYNQMPSPVGDTRRQFKGKKRYDHQDRNDNERAFDKSRKFKKGGRYRVNDNDDDAYTPGTIGGGQTVATADNGTFTNNPFAGLNITPALAEPAEKLPEPPPEQPVV